jgi:hypothetical protein
LAELDLPEEDAVVAAMLTRTGLPADLYATQTHLDAINTEMAEVRDRLEQAQGRERIASSEALGEVLSRWPVLDDPWHPLFARTLSEHRVALEEHLASSERVRALWSAMDDTDRLAAALETLRAKRAPLARLQRALENRVLAGRLRQLGGRNWRIYQGFLECERWVPGRHWR